MITRFHIDFIFTAGQVKSLDTQMDWVCQEPHKQEKQNKLSHATLAAGLIMSSKTYWLTRMNHQTLLINSLQILIFSFSVKA